MTCPLLLFFLSSPRRPPETEKYAHPRNTSNTSRHRQHGSKQRALRLRAGCGARAERRRQSFAPGSPFRLIAVRHAELALQIPHQSHQFLLVLGIGLLRPFGVSSALKGGGSLREERWSSEKFAAGDGSRPLTELADWHSPLEVLLEKIVDPSQSVEPAIPIDDKSEYRPKGDQAPNECRNPIHGLFASRRCQGN